MSEHPVRPQTPQAMLHRLPDRPQFLPTETRQVKPSKYIILIVASTAVAGKAQIAQSVADALACPLFQGDSLHETSARAASVGKPAEASKTGDLCDVQGLRLVTEPNKDRYQRMWLSKMTRTGYLFPEESRPATEGFSGFGGNSSSSSPASSVHRGSSSSTTVASTIVSGSNSKMKVYLFTGETQVQPGYINKPPPTVALSKDEDTRRTNPALMVITHPILEQWHKESIRHVVGDYGIGVIFVPLDQDKELPVLKPLDPTTMTNFASLQSLGNSQRTTPTGSLDDEILLDVDTEMKVEDIIEEVIKGVRDRHDVSVYTVLNLSWISSRSYLIHALLHS